ncbi:MAG TPA: hypothetical protein VHW74_06740 [Mycobacteriales bacterium]|nr:hypothetical protein [Mycobacteriales bacterium]
MAKQRSADWQVDLKPVTLTPRNPAAPFTTENGAAPHVEHATYDAALTQTLSAVTTAVTELSRAVEAIGRRLDGLERAAAEQASNSQSLANELLTRATTAATTAAAAPPAAAPLDAAPDAPARPVRATSRALRDSTTAPLERRSRRAASAPATAPKDGAEQ